MSPESLKLPLSEKRAFQRSLLRWYTSHKRDLPWRKNPDPYRVMVSEFMLQQTRVETVLPYYERFLKTFPTLQSLARASLQSVLKVWAGMGYYARARHLLSATKTILRRHGGVIPSTKKELLSLLGFGPYMAGAVASIAFNEPVAALDGNVRRVMGRLLGFREVISTPREKRVLENLAEDLIPSGRTSDFNQALMDLGAMICIAIRPRCPQCPVKRFCAWRATELAGVSNYPSPLAGEGLPCGVSSSTPQGEGGGNRKRSSLSGIGDQNKKPKVKKIRKEVWAVALIEKDGRFLIHRKEGKGLLAGLWQFPTLGLDEKIFKEGHRTKEAIKKAIRNNYGLRIKIKAQLTTTEHQFTHLDVTMKPYLCSVAKISPCDQAPKHIRWIRPSDLSRYPISRAMGKISTLMES